MRSALFVSALLATALFGGTALAERTSDDTSSRHYSSAQDLKERVLHERAQPQQATHESTRSTERAPSKVSSFRGKGENYENYGRGTSSTTSARSPAAASHATSAMPSKMMPGRSHGDVVDGSSRKGSGSSSNATKATVGSTQATWTAGGKSVRSFVHFTNDKGETNNNVHGATATAAKMRLVANIIMKTAIRDPHVKAFSWSTAGGDNQSLFPGD